MHIAGEDRMHSELRGLIVEASLALASLDAGRLEELAQCCRALNGDPGSNLDERSELQRQAREAAREMEVFGGVLDATRANLEVMNRMRDRRREDLEYPAGRRTGWTLWSAKETCDGNS